MAGINSFEKGAYHIANNQVEYNPQRKNNFTLVVQGLTNLKRVGAAEGTTDPKEIIADGQKELILGLKENKAANGLYLPFGPALVLAGLIALFTIGF